MARTRGGSSGASASPKPIRGRVRPRPSVFRFQDLPPTVRGKILKLAICPDGPLQIGFAGHRGWLADAIRLFRTSKAVCRESMAVFYHHCEINSWSYRSGVAERFLARTVQPWAPAPGKISIHFHLFEESLTPIGTLFSSSLLYMAINNTLHDLDIIIGTKEPSIVQNRQDLFPCAQIRLPGGYLFDDYAFLAEPPFQAVLHLISRPSIAKIRVRIEKDFHLGCWCPFHEDPRAGERCLLYRGLRPVPRGSVISLQNPPVLEVDWRSIVSAYLGATIVKPLPRGSIVA